MFDEKVDSIQFSVANKITINKEHIMSCFTLLVQTLYQRKIVNRHFRGDDGETFRIYSSVQELAPCKWPFETCPTTTQRVNESHASRLPDPPPCYWSGRDPPLFKGAEGVQVGRQIWGKASVLSFKSHLWVQWSAPVYTPIPSIYLYPVSRAVRWLNRWVCVRVVLWWSLYHGFLCLRLLLFLSVSIRVFLSSVHIGGPQNAVCRLAGYLFFNVVCRRWICWCVNFGICCVYVVLRRRRVCRQQEYVFHVQSERNQTNPDCFIPHTGSKCAIIFMYHRYQHIEHRHTQTEIHTYCTGSKMCHD